MGDSDKYVRRAAAGALGNFSDTSALEPLIAASKENDEYLPGIARKSLDKIATSAVEPLIAMLHDRSIDRRKSAISILVNVGDARAFEPFHGRTSTIAMRIFARKPLTDWERSATPAQLSRS